ncbi:MAG: 5-bromo-4-chloroindolyl phosphate hydrolysis family protein [Lachnospiraceae bacterium]|nr:5-bromo-4-chloroindolyl phosphate hydrolysis family protein [Lachnospiraceae bacterium]MDE7179398.1 5-bromo-4-chloroindolyl phosphate hydrolysis family protein [Lachnospiraceae bacterium]
MDRNEWYRAGEDIRDQVQQAVDTGDFTNLGKNIGNTVNETINRTMREVNRTVGTVGDNVNRTVGAVGEGVNRVVNNVGNGISRAAGNMGRGTGGAPLQPQSPYAHLPQYRRPNTRPDTRLFQSTPKGSVSGILCMCAGFSIMGIAALAIPTAIAEMVAYAANASTLSTALILFAGGLGVGIHGTRLTGRASRYKRYVSMVRDKLYCSIQEMAVKTGRNERFVIKDLKKMIRLGMFKQGRLDQRETCLIASDEMYNQYMLTQKNYEEEQKKLEIEKLADERKQKERERLGEAAEVIEEGKSYVRLIRQCNDEIPGEEMSDKLDRLELLVSRIFEQVEKEPELAPELRKMLSFYLPTTKKLLEAYRDLDRQQLDLSNVEQTKREIEAAVDNINEAFEKFLDELFREKAWDIQSDISALHTILKQDGYLD